MQVTVKTLDSETRVFTVSDEATVEEFKRQIASDVGIPSERQRLIFKGKVLQDANKLQSYGADGCVIHLVERRPPAQRPVPDGASAERPNQDGSQTGEGFNMGTDVMNISQQIVQGIISQLGLNSGQANVSTTQSGDGATLNVHINLLSSSSPASDAGARISRARQFLRAGRSSLNRSEGENSVLPESNVSMETSQTTSDPHGNSQESSTDSSNQNNSPDMLADVLGELLELNSTVQPYIQRYITLLNSNSTESLLPSDDSLPDRVAEALHNLSHAYHAISDLTFNFRSPEPRSLSILPSLSNHMGAAPFLSSLFSGNQPSQTSTSPGQQPSQSSSGDARVQVVPGSTIAFTSIISGSLPPSGIYNQQPSATTTGGTNRPGNSSSFNFSFGSLGNQGNSQQTTTNTSSNTSSTQSSAREGEGRDNVRIVMDDFVALFSNAQPVTSHSETSRTSTSSQRHSQGDTDTQTQSSGTTTSSRAVPRVNIGSLPGNGNHPDPLVPCESFHFGPRSRQPQGTQGSNTQGNPANGFAQAFSDAIASALQGAMTGQTGQGSDTERPNQSTTTATTQESEISATTSSTTQTASSTPSQSETPNPLAEALSSLRGEAEHQRHTNPFRVRQQAARREREGGVNPVAEAREMLQSVFMNTIARSAQDNRDPTPQSLRDFLNEVDEAASGITEETSSEIQGPFLQRVINRLSRTMSLQDFTFMMMGLPEPYTQFRDIARQHLLVDLLDGAPPNDTNLLHVARMLVEELMDKAGECLVSIRPEEGIDIVETVRAFMEDAVHSALLMSRDLDVETFNSRFPDYLKQSMTDLSILLSMCYELGVTGATYFVGMRLPYNMTEDIDERMLQSLQATAIRYVEQAYRFKPQRERILQQYIRRTKDKDDENSVPEREPDANDSVSQNSDDSESFSTPPLSMSLNDEYTQLEDQDDVDMVDDDTNDWKAVVQEDWVPIIVRDVIRQRRLPQQAPFSDAYNSGLPPKRRKTADQRAVSSTSDTMSTVLRQAVMAAGVTPKTSLEAVVADARKRDDLHEAYRGEVKKALKQRTNKDSDYRPESFPSTKDYLERS